MTAPLDLAVSDDGPPQAQVEEIPYVEPSAVLACLGKEAAVVFLDSACAEEGQSAWSYLVAAPAHILTARSGQCTVDGETSSGPILGTVQKFLRRYQRPPMHAQAEYPPFTGGFVGYFGYELGGELETLPVLPAARHDLPDMWLGFFDCGLAFDTARRRAFVFWQREKAVAETWRRRCREAENLVLTPLHEPTHPLPVRSNFTRQAYEASVGRVVEYIRAGDIFQANLSQCFFATLPSGFSAFDLYRRLRQASPAPYAAFIRFDDKAILSSSPEQFIHLDAGGHITTHPIKGTRPRGKTPAQDADLAATLMTSEKDRAENIMIVDLMRNDLSRVCENFSVRVDTLCALKSFANVHHLVSTVSGHLRPEFDAIDVIRAVFPGGSITGAPKIRAMEIISEQEGEARGPYCGAIGFIGLDGTMNLNIAIRTLVMDGERLSFHVGGGIVAQSEPQAEYEETLDKAAGLLKALRAEIDGSQR